MSYRATFTHPDKWKDIFLTIIEKLGREFYKWDNGIGFEDDETVIVISHRDGQQKARFHLVNIDVSQPSVAGGWFTTLREEKKKVIGITLRDYRRKCRVKVRYDKKELEAVLSFDSGHNSAPIGDKVYIEPLGWCDTEDVELIEVLP